MYSVLQKLLGEPRRTCRRITNFFGYDWYFENNVSLIIDLGPSYTNSSKKSENLKSSVDYE